MLFSCETYSGGLGSLQTSRWLEIFLHMSCSLFFSLYLARLNFFVGIPSIFLALMPFPSINFSFSLDLCASMLIFVFALTLHWRGFLESFAGDCLGLVFFLPMMNRGAP